MVDNSFPKENRLLGEVDFSRVYSSGERFEKENFVFYLQNRDEGEPRIGIVTPKYLGTAVERNRIKRVIRESFRKNKRLFDSLEFIVKPRHRATELNNTALGENFLDEFPAD
jgi:ribonuclease P protein component